MAQACANGSLGGTGTGTAFPFLQPGWLFAQPGPLDPVSCSVSGRYDASVPGFLRALPAVLRTAVDPGFWWFWVFNNGVVVIVAVLLTAYAALHGLSSVRERVRFTHLRARVGAAVPDALLRFSLPFVAIFAVCNVVVFQTWDWDNTKLLAYWYLGGALLTAAVLVHWLRGGTRRRVAAGLMLASLLAAGGLNLTRYVRDPHIPYTWASAADRELAAAVDARTPKNAVFLTEGNPTDPLLTLAGRTAVSGYAGWLYSYGIDTGMRPQDSAAILAGCDATPAPCQVTELLRKYRIDFVEVCFDATNPLCSGAAWFGRTYQLVARSSAVSVYDVRSP